MQRTGQHVNYVTLKSYIESQMSGSNWSAKKAFLELIDNAFDAGATQIEIARAGDCVSITDNGCGTDVPYCIVELTPGPRLGGRMRGTLTYYEIFLVMKAAQGLLAN